MWTGTYDQQDAARVLMEKGADPTLKDHNGITASGWATKNHHDALAQRLRDADKKR